MNTELDLIYREVVDNSPGLLKSIADDDVCSDCANLYYKPGEDSLCLKAVTSSWPAIFDEDGLAIHCDIFELKNQEKLSSFDEWELEVIDLLTDSFGSRGDAQGYAECHQVKLRMLYEKGLPPEEGYNRALEF